MKIEKNLLIFIAVMFPLLLCTIMYASVRYQELRIPDFYLSAGKSILYLSMMIYCLFIFFIDDDLSSEISGLFVMIITISMFEGIHNIVKAYGSFLARRQFERSVHNAS